MVRMDIGHNQEAFEDAEIRGNAFGPEENEFFSNVNLRWTNVSAKLMRDLEVIMSKKKTMAVVLCDIRLAVARSTVMVSNIRKLPKPLLSLSMSKL